MNNEEKSIAVAPAIAAASAVTAIGIAKHNIDLNNQDKIINSKRFKKFNDFKNSLMPGDVLVQNYSRKSSYRPIPAIPLKNSDLIHSSYGNQYSHAGMYAGNGRVVHSGGSGNKIKYRGVKDFSKGTDVVAIRYGGKKEGDVAIKKAIKQLGKPYYNAKETFAATAKEIIGLSTKVPKCPDKHHCLSVVNTAHARKVKSLNEHPLEAVRRGSAKIIGSHKGFRGPSAIESIPYRVIAPTLRSAKIALPVAAAAGIATKILSKDKSDS